jgi:protein FrlC
MVMKLGLCTMIYLDYLTLEDAIRHTAKAGFEGIDIWADSPHLDPLRKDKSDRNAIKKLAADEGLEICALALNGGALNRRYNFSYSKEWVRRDTLDYCKLCVDLAAEIGCPRINLFSGHMMADTSREQAWQWNYENMAAVCEYAGKNGVMACLHTLTPSESRVVVTLDDAIEMHRQINMPSCKIMIDTADQNITDPDLTTAVWKVAKDLDYIHVSDNTGEGLGLVHMIPGKGTVNWRFFVSTLRDAGYNGYITAQIYAAHPIDPDAWVADTHAYLSRVLDECGVHREVPAIESR